jgi:predicted nucleic acid-binding protein
VAPVYVLDACVLYPVVLRDLLLTLSAFDAFEVRWTEEILDEMTRNLLANHSEVDPARFEERVVGAMRAGFPEALIVGYEHRIDAVDNDAKDRHVAAAAVHVNADAIVTYNVRDFGGDVLRRHGVSVVTPPQVIGRLLEDEPSVVTLAIRAMAARKKRPPMTPADVVAAVLRQQGFRVIGPALRAVAH